MKILGKLNRLASKIKQLNKLDQEHIEALPSSGIITLHDKTPHDGLLIKQDEQIGELFRDMSGTIDRMVDECVRLKTEKESNQRKLKSHMIKKGEE